MISLKKTVICVLLITVICAAAFFISPAGDIIFASNEQMSRIRVIVDAGHGGFDGGAMAGDGTVEKDINLSISVFLKGFLEQSGFEVILTRDSDTGTDDDSSEKIAVRKKSDLRNRLNLMQKYPDAIFVSVHLNKFTTSAASGAQVFYSKNHSNSSRLGQCVQGSIISLLQKENTRVIKQATSSTYLLNNATIPAIIVECGFLSNAGDLALLKDEAYQRKMAFCIYSGIKEYYKE